ncbi:MAG: tetratricopeptide repeat protein [Salinivirgaceae bacterium]|jgi:tetratricopeptide (TPR) repeat protein
MTDGITESERLFKEFKLDESRELLERILLADSDNKDALLLLGKIHSRTQNFGSAINCFNNVLAHAPENLEAQTGLALIKNILQLTNNYYFENAYTDDDLYESNL